MDIKSPKVFETSDKAHADLFNEMVKVLLENDSGLLDRSLNILAILSRMHLKKRRRNGMNHSYIKSQPMTANT
ncbi:hypothetical protein ABEW20_07700 [Bacillus safensis]